MLNKKSAVEPLINLTAAPELSGSSTCLATHVFIQVWTRSMWARTGMWVRRTNVKGAGLRLCCITSLPASFPEVQPTARGKWNLDALWLASCILRFKFRTQHVGLLLWCVWRTICKRVHWEPLPDSLLWLWEVARKQSKMNKQNYASIQWTQRRATVVSSLWRKHFCVMWNWHLILKLVFLKLQWVETCVIKELPYKDTLQPAEMNRQRNTVCHFPKWRQRRRLEVHGAILTRSSLKFARGKRQLGRYCLEM